MGGENGDWENMSSSMMGKSRGSGRVEILEGILAREKEKVGSACGKKMGRGFLDRGENR